MATRVRGLLEVDWQLARALRLRALQESPDSFASTYEQERAMSDARWQARAHSNAQRTETAGYVAMRDGEAVGMAIGVRAGEQVELNALWVAPEARRLGAARALVEAVVSWAKEVGAQTVALQVTHSSVAARELYLHMGFVEVCDATCGERQAAAVRMRLMVPGGGSTDACVPGTATRGSQR